MTYLQMIRELPCCVCGAIGVQAHHTGGGSMKRYGIHKAKSRRTPDIFCVPLCPKHHTGEEGIHSLGVLTWEARFNHQVHYVLQTLQTTWKALETIAVIESVITKAKPRRKNHPTASPAKMLPRRVGRE